VTKAGEFAKKSAKGFSRLRMTGKNQENWKSSATLKEGSRRARSTDHFALFLLTKGVKDATLADKSRSATKRAPAQVFFGDGKRGVGIALWGKTKAFVVLTRAISKPYQHRRTVERNPTRKLRAEGKNEVRPKIAYPRKPCFLFSSRAVKLEEVRQERKGVKSLGIRRKTKGSRKNYHLG